MHPGREDGTLNPVWLGASLVPASRELLAGAGSANVAASLQHGRSGGPALLGTAVARALGPGEKSCQG